MMKLMTRHDIARTAAQVYLRDNFHVRGDPPAWRVTYHALVALGDSPSVQDVDGICEGLTNLSCGECNDAVDAVVQIGDEPDYDADTVWVCAKCLERAILLTIASSEVGQ